MRIPWTYLLIAGYLLSSCSKTEMGIPVATDDSAPDPVRDVRVENIPGGAVLTYTLPESDGLLYIMAEYSRVGGIISEKKKSYYENKIELEGFPDAKTYEVKLYAVSRGGKKSDPVFVKIQPKTPPVVSVFQSL